MAERAAGHCRAAGRRCTPALFLLIGLFAAGAWGVAPAHAQANAASPSPAPAPASASAPTSSVPASDSADETDTPEPAPAPRAARAARPPVAPRFELTIEAPEALRELLERHLDIQRFRLQRSLDAAELERLLIELPDNAPHPQGCGGRTLSYDAFETTYDLLSYGGLDGADDDDGVTAHTDVTDEFPFLGPPH